MVIPAKADPGSMLEAVMLEGDLSKMPPEQRVKYYNEVCTSLGLNPLTRPFQYIVLNGKLQLYALRACTDQLRKIHTISLQIVSRDVADGMLTVHCRATAPDRFDEDIGVVPFPDSLKGDARANTEMKAVTKAKRRATLSLCGLGWLDESEIETVKDAKPVAGPDVMANPAAAVPAAAATAARPGDGAPAAVQGNAGNRHGAGDNDAPRPDPAQPSPGRLSIGEIQKLEIAARQAAEKGSAAMAAFWRSLKTPQQQNIVSGLRDELKALRDAADAALGKGIDPATGEIID